jgi:ATP-binding cassette subfamily F protein 3
MGCQTTTSKLISFRVTNRLQGWTYSTRYYHQPWALAFGFFVYQAKRLFMLTVHQISKSYGFETILDDVSFNLNSGERLGLVGPNGCGKTTLLRIIVGLEYPDSGGIQFDPPDLRSGYLPQGFDLSAGTSENVVTIQNYLTRHQDDVHSLTHRLEQLATALTNTPARAELQSEYDAVLSRLQVGSQNAGRVPEVLAALGLERIPAKTPVRKLSGGQKTRLALAGVLLSEPQFLLLDEPTNHLDLTMLSWLEEWLRAFRGGVLLISHDRVLLDRTTTAILDLDRRTHKIHQYPGNYTAYLEARVVEKERRWQAYRNQQDEISRLRRAAATCCCSTNLLTTLTSLRGRALKQLSAPLRAPSSLSSTTASLSRALPTRSGR